jgi:hypothetical protein
LTGTKSTVNIIIMPLWSLVRVTLAETIGGAGFVLIPLAGDIIQRKEV